MDDVTLRRFGSEKCMAIYCYQPTAYSGVIPHGGLYCTLGHQVIEIIRAANEPSAKMYNYAEGPC